MELVWFLLIGVVAGWLAGVLFKGSGYGVLGDMIIGVIGAFLGGWLLGELGIIASGSLGLLVTATIGALVLVFLLSLMRRRPA